ncbi:PRC-barrel domain-containing protein [Nodosilinea sp. P-1105]|uniref:PRC-barrel domain-containing protein n=1 Tax=Nodosilinea sp. P-1105 TaxID=2546229 RepID=UPI00146DB3F0|nr:PRC-barrel domain-containing protein [Nodosilinea sp. P-1105]NMF83138.1 photosystem reaction center subunit H [Nodosilinea sp. P-1105]
MSTAAQTLAFSTLLKRPVLNRQTVEELGQTTQLLVDAQAQRVTGLVCKSGFLGTTKRAFSWDQIEAIGKDSILVRVADSPQASSPDMTEAPIGFEILTDHGNTVGKVTDLLFELESGRVTGYLFTPHGWKGLMEGTYIFAPIAISSVGEKRVIVLESAVEAPQQYTPGLGAKLTQASDFIQADYERTKQDLADLQKGAQDLAHKVKGESPNTDDSAQE